MQYGFKDFGQKAETLSPSIRVIMNGITLDEYLSNNSFSFQTLTVDGRGKTMYRTESTDIKGMHGSALEGTSLGNRVIVVRALVKATTNEAYRRGMERLNLQGYSRVVHELSFTDDTQHTFYAICQRIEDEDERSNTQIVEMEFLCTDPYKYTALKEVTASSSQALSLDTDIAIVPEEIELTFSSAASAKNWTITNARDGNRIRYQQSSSANGTRIRVRQKEDYIGYVEEVNHISDLNVRYSDFDEFTIQNGDRITVSPTPTQIKIKYKGARL